MLNISLTNRCLRYLDLMTLSPNGRRSEGKNSAPPKNCCIHSSAHRGEHPLAPLQNRGRIHSSWELLRRTWFWSHILGWPFDLLFLWDIYLCSATSFLSCEMMVPASSLILLFCLFCSPKKGKILGCQQVSSSSWDTRESRWSYLFVSGKSSS